MVEYEGLEAKEAMKSVIREDGNGIVCQIQELYTENKILNVMSETIMATGVIYKHHPTKINISFPLKDSYFLYYSTSISMFNINPNCHKLLFILNCYSK